MDDFRIDQVSADNPYREQGESHARRRKKDSPHEPMALEEDTVLLSGQVDAAEQPIEDTYTPSSGPQDQ